jgi:hypothetical protein
MWIDTHVGAEQYMAIEMTLETEDHDVIETTTSCHYEPTTPSVEVAHAIRLVRLGWGVPVAAMQQPMLADWENVHRDYEPIAQIRPVPGTQTTAAGTPLTRSQYMLREYPSFHFQTYRDDQIHRDEMVALRLSEMVGTYLRNDEMPLHYMLSLVPRYADFRARNPPSLPPSRLYEHHVTQ